MQEAFLLWIVTTCADSRFFVATDALPLRGCEVALAVAYMSARFVQFCVAPWLRKREDTVLRVHFAAFDFVVFWSIVLWSIYEWKDTMYKAAFTLTYDGRAHSASCWWRSACRADKFSRALGHCGVTATDCKNVQDTCSSGNQIQLVSSSGMRSAILIKVRSASTAAPLTSPRSSCWQLASAGTCTCCMVQKKKGGPSRARPSTLSLWGVGQCRSCATAGSWQGSEMRQGDGCGELGHVRSLAANTHL